MSAVILINPLEVPLGTGRGSPALRGTSGSRSCLGGSLMFCAAVRDEAEWPAVVARLALRASVYL